MANYQEGGLYPSNPTTLELMRELNFSVELESFTAPVSELVSADAVGWTATYHFQGRDLALYWYVGSKVAEDPTADEILSTHIRNVIDEDISFEEWCRESDYDSDSRKRERQYKDEMEISRNIRAFLGKDYDRFLEAD